MSRDQIQTSVVTRSSSPSIAEIDMPSIGPFASAFSGPVRKKQQDTILEIVVGD
jgi:hypothetical protein